MQNAIVTPVAAALKSETVRICQMQQSVLQKALRLRAKLETVCSMKQENVRRSISALPEVMPANVARQSVQAFAVVHRIWKGLLPFLFSDSLTLIFMFYRHFTCIL